MKDADLFTIDLVSPILRATNAVIFAVIGLSQILAAAGEGISVAGMLLLVITALGALLEERWVFNLKSETASFRFGLLFAAHKRTIPFNEITAVEFDDFEKGFNKQQWTRIVMRVTSGKDEIIDTVNRKRALKLIEKAERLAEFFKSRMA